MIPRGVDLILSRGDFREASRLGLVTDVRVAVIAIGVSSLSGNGFLRTLLGVVLIGLVVLIITWRIFSSDD